jgi:hypothetical protein
MRCLHGCAPLGSLPPVPLFSNGAFPTPRARRPPPPAQVFALFDRDGSNRISTEELAAVLCGADSDDELCIPDAVPAALRRVDADGDGFVDFGEFLSMLHTSDADSLELFPSRRLPRATSPGGARRTARGLVEERRRLQQEQQQQRQQQQQQQQQGATGADAEAAKPLTSV